MSGLEKAVSHVVFLRGRHCTARSLIVSIFYCFVYSIEFMSVLKCEAPGLGISVTHLCVTGCVLCKVLTTEFEAILHRFFLPLPATVCLIATPLGGSI